MKVFIPEMVSSEESNSDGEDVIKVKPLPGRSSRVTQMFHDLDEKVEGSKTVQAKRQKRRRVIAMNNSTRSQPPSVPSWATKD